MKKLILSLSMVALFAVSCTTTDETVTQQPAPTPVGSGEITGDFTANKTFIKGNYTLKGMVKIPTGITVTFDAGSTITCTVATGENGLVVLNGGKLIMNGTATEPIVLTESSKVPGSWAGILMYGDAPIINSATAALPQTATSEDGLALPYGGANLTHNGGTLRYVRVEYAGRVITQNNKEHNGFSFYAVGSGTILENLVSYKGNDDGFEFYGGNVSLKNSISYGNTDDAFDWQDGWSGQDNTNWFAYQTGKANYGLEVEAKSVNNSFFPRVTNITLKRAAGTITESLSEIQLDAFQFKKEGNGDYSNIVVDGFKTYTYTDPVSGTTISRNGGVVQVLDANTNTNQVAGGKVKITNIKITNCDNNFISGAASFTTSASTFNPTTNWNPTTTATGASLTAGAWATVDGVNLLANLN